MKKILLTIFCLLSVLAAVASAAPQEDKYKVAVMDFGGRKGLSTNTVNTAKTGDTATDYIIEALVESGRFEVIDKTIIEETLRQEKISTTGIVNPDAAQRIGNLLGVRYIVYGNVNGVGGGTDAVHIISAGADVHTVKAVIIARMMDVETGDIVTAVRGEGKSKSSKIKGGTEGFGYITVGTKKISQVAVHNAVKKAAYAVAEKLLLNLDTERSDALDRK